MTVTPTDLILVVGGGLLLIAPFIRRFRVEAPLSSWLVIFLAGLAVEFTVAFRHYYLSLRGDNYPLYLRMMGLNNGIRGIAIGILVTVLVRFFCARATKNPNA